jgi:hypothetical protein
MQIFRVCPVTSVYLHIKCETCKADMPTVNHEEYDRLRELMCILQPLQRLVIHTSRCALVYIVPNVLRLNAHTLKCVRFETQVTNYYTFSKQLLIIQNGLAVLPDAQQDDLAAAMHLCVHLTHISLFRNWLAHFGMTQPVLSAPLALEQLDLQNSWCNSTYKNKYHALFINRLRSVFRLSVCVCVCVLYVSCTDIKFGV